MSEPSVQGIVEYGLYVEDLERSKAFYQRVLGLEPIFQEPGRLEALGVAGRHVLLLFKAGGTLQPVQLPGGTIPPHDAAGRQHFAFAIAKEDLPGWEERLRAQHVVIESRVNINERCTSLYFRDPDGHLVELITPGCWKVY
ncbi:MAG: VOC family protein [Bryobacteraceae bacterium]|nr:VOC family protein [Bryobacteraceae bacterium]